SRSSSSGAGSPCSTWKRCRTADRARACADAAAGSIRWRMRRQTAAGRMVRRQAGQGAMTRPVVGIIGNSALLEQRFLVQGAGERNLAAVADVTGALPLIFGGKPRLTDIPDLLDTV